MKLIIISALFFILSFPDFSLWIIPFFALVPFFMAIERASEIKRGFIYGLLWGGIIAVGMGFWLMQTMIHEYGASLLTAIMFMTFGLIFPVGLLYGFFSIIYNLVKNESLLFYTLVLPSLWILIDYIRELIPIMIPWGFIGYAVFPCNKFIQIADVAGIYGISFIIVMINSLIVYIVKDINWSDLKIHHSLNDIIRIIIKKRIPLVLLITVIILPILYGIVRTMQFSRIINEQLAGNEKINTVLIQGNFSNKERWTDLNFYHRLETYLGLSRGNNSPGACLIVWPETVLNSAGKINEDLFAYIMSRIGKESLLITGGVRESEDKKGVYNTAYIIFGDGRIFWYDKNILLPYSEISPFGLGLEKYYNAPTEFYKGKTIPAIKTDMSTIGLSICFESLYPWYIRESVQRGAQLLVNISNDSWFGRISEPALHLQSSCIRAIENRRFLVRVSNSGISAIIQPTGQIVEQSDLFKREKINGTICQLNELTLYSRLGDWILYCAVFILFLILIKNLIQSSGAVKKD